MSNIHFLVEKCILFKKKDVAIDRNQFYPKMHTGVNYDTAAYSLTMLINVKVKTF